MNDTGGSEKGFLTGFFLGSVVAFGAGYLTFTKSGRALTKQLLKAAEELGERGEEMLENVESMDIDEVGELVVKKKEEAKSTMSSLIGKLKGESAHEKKSAKKN